MRLLLRVVLAALVAPALVVSVPSVAGAADCPAPGGSRVPEATAAGDVVFRGHGWGHGMGMSQYGAQGAALLGCGYAEILQGYYAGTRVVPETMPGSIQLRLLDGGYRTDVRAETADVVWELAGCAVGCPPVQPQGSLWRLQLDDTKQAYALYDPAAAVDPVTGKQRPLWTGGSAAQPLRLRHSGQVVRLTTWRANSIYLDRRLRWDHTVFALDAGTLDAVQVIEASAAGTAMDKYLWGVAEVPSSFPVEALKAQAVAARTYAAKRAGRVLMPTPADQNYTGYAKESEGPDQVYGKRWRAAVDATSGRVLKTTGGAYVDALYSSSFGGYSEDRRYVWGPPEIPQLHAVDDSRWELASSNPAKNRSWAVGLSWADLTARLRAYGTRNAIPAMVFDQVTAISVPARGSSARWAGVTVTGLRSCTAVTTRLEGWDVRQALGLLSPGFTVSTPGTGTGQAPAACDTGYVPLDPARLHDTRATRNPLGPGERVDVRVTGRGGVPAAGVAAVALNVTAVRPTRTTYLTVWPAGGRRPTASSLNLPARGTRAAYVVAAVGSGGRVSVVNASGTADLVVDVAGYYVLPAAGGQLYHPTQPFRLYDSRRDARGALGNNAARTLTLPTIDGTPAEGMGAAVVNVTAVGAAGTGYLTVHPAGSRRPAASTLNFAGRATVSNRAAAKLSGGALTVTNRGGGVHVVVDVVGWFADPVVAGGHAYRPLAPVRVLDTRSGKGAARAPVGPGTTLSLTVAGAGRPLPADASAVVMTLTSTGATAPTYVTAWPAGAARPATSDLNVRARQTTANLVVVPVGAAGAISLFNRFGSTHLVGDVVGYYR